MAHESFEDDATAALMNARFINIKVDREERPDLDSIYMSAVTSCHDRARRLAHDRVPHSADGQPFYSGTYFPREPRYGMPSFRQISRPRVAERLGEPARQGDGGRADYDRHLQQSTGKSTRIGPKKTLEPAQCSRAQSRTTREPSTIAAGAVSDRRRSFPSRW